MPSKLARPEEVEPPHRGRELIAARSSDAYCRRLQAAAGGGGVEVLRGGGAPAPSPSAALGSRGRRRGGGRTGGDGRSGGAARRGAEVLPRLSEPEQ